MKNMFPEVKARLMREWLAKPENRFSTVNEPTANAVEVFTDAVNHVREVTPNGLLFDVTFFEDSLRWQLGLN